MSMTAKRLREILELLPDDTHICSTDGENGSLDLGSVRYLPQFSICYVEPNWTREHKKEYDNINMNGEVTLRGEIRYGKETLSRIWQIAHEAKLIVDSKNDGKKHRIEVFIDIDMPDIAQCGCIDGREWFGADCTRGHREKVLEFDWESLGLRLN